MVCVADINVLIGKKIAALVGIDLKAESASTLPEIRILDPNPGKTFVLKYKYNQKAITKH
jgi:hypothetical protein